MGLAGRETTWEEKSRLGRNENGGRRELGHCLEQEARQMLPAKHKDEEKIRSTKVKKGNKSQGK